MSTYPTYKLGEIIDKVPIEFKVKQKEYLPKGKFPVVDQGQDLIGGFVDDESLLVKTELPVIVFGDHTKVKKFIEFPFVAGADGTKIIKPKKEFFIEPKLFYWFLHCVKFPDKGYARHFQYLLKSDIAVPPLSTQHAIVTRIETLFAELDKAVQHLRTAQQQLKTYRLAVLNHWLNNEDGKWEMVKLGEVVDVRDGTHDTPKYVQSGIPFVTQKNITEFGISFSNVQYITEEEHLKFYERSNVAKNDILIAMIGANRGNATIVDTDAVFSIKNVGLIKYKPDTFNNKFLLFYLRSQGAKNYIKGQSKGGAQEFIGLKELRNFPVLCPPLAEQHRIVQEIESRLSQATATETYIENALQQAEALRQSILKKAFSGELV